MRLYRPILIAAACLLLGAGCRASLPDTQPKPSSVAAPVVTPVPSSVLLPVPAATRLSTPAKSPAPTGVLAETIPPMPPRDLKVIEREGPTLEADAIGAVRTFRIADLDAAGYREVQATLQYASARVEMWVEEGATATRRGLAESTQAIEERILSGPRAIVWCGSGVR